jgi:serine protease SohB
MLSEFLVEYGIFFAKITTVVVLVLLVALVMSYIITRSRGVIEGHLEVTNLNNKFEQMRLMINSAILSRKAYKKALKEVKAKHKKPEDKIKTQGKQPRVFVVNFKGDIRASQVNSLREEVTAVLSVAKAEDEVVVRLESSGGTVHGYGLAASQLKRIRDKGIKLTVCVDKVAASGGYMMASVANKIIAAPFAIIGSIGVLAQIPNFHRLLKKHDIDFEQFTAGKYKRSLSIFGENTEEGRDKLKHELEEVHQLFKQFITENRKNIDIDKISTGEYWYGKHALELNLVDEIQTSDDYLSSISDTASLYEIRYIRKKPVLEKIFSTMKMIIPDEV